MKLVVAKGERLAPLRHKLAGHLVVHEVYRSIQGESTFASLPFVFVRLTACLARCTWCDTPHSFKEGVVTPLDVVLTEVLRYDCPLVELTGGEPLLQPEAFTLMAALADQGKTVLLETSGLVPIHQVDCRVRVIMDLKCPASGECENNHWPNLSVLKPEDEVKFVIASRRDFDWVEGVIREHSLHRRFAVLLSAVFEMVKPMELADWLLATALRARRQLQMHKYIWYPSRRGV